MLRGIFKSKIHYSFDYDQADAEIAALINDDMND